MSSEVPLSLTLFNKYFYALLFFPVCFTCPTHPIFLNYLNLTFFLTKVMKQKDADLND